MGKKGQAVTLVAEDEQLVMKVVQKQLGLSMEDQRLAGFDYELGGPVAGTGTKAARRKAKRAEQVAQHLQRTKPGRHGASVATGAVRPAGVGFQKKGQSDSELSETSESESESDMDDDVGSMLVWPQSSDDDDDDEGAGVAASTDIGRVDKRKRILSGAAKKRRKQK